MRAELISALAANQRAFGIELSDQAVERLADYYELVQENNPLLHLVAPCSPEEFAIRHILESLTLLEHLPNRAKFADIGAGAGLPSIPCLLVRDDLSAVLIESKLKKARFLELAIQRLGLSARADVIDRQFGEVDPANCQFVTCRALDKFIERMPRLLKWAEGKKLFLFSGPLLAESLDTHPQARYTEHLIPLSEQRYLYLVEPKTERV